MTIYTLYVKTHKKTGLKYFGQTSNPNPQKYKGSGYDWVDHISKHGYDVVTDIIFQSTDINERNYWGRYYSKLWNIVNAQDDFGNKIWANRIPETGGGPGGAVGSKNGAYGKTPWNKGLTKETDKRVASYGKSLSASTKGKVAHNKGKKGQVAWNKGKPNISILGSNNPAKRLEVREKMKAAWAKRKARALHPGSQK